MSLLDDIRQAAVDNSEIEALLIRLDEKTKGIEEVLVDVRSELKANRAKFATVEDVNRLRDRLDRFEDAYITKIEFTPVKSVVFGLVGIVCVAVAGALVALVVRS